MALREVLAKFGFEVDSKKLEDADKKTESYADKLKEIAGVLLGEQLVSGIREFVSGLTDQAGALQDSADRLAINATELQRWELAAKLSGASAEELHAGLKVLQKTAAEASTEGGDAAASFKKLGIDLKLASGEIKPANELLEDTLLGLSKIEDPSLRNAEAFKLMGKGALALGPLMKDGAEGLDKLLNKLDDLGGGLSEDALQVLNDAGDRFDEFDFAVTSLKSRLAVDLFPTINDLLVRFNRWIGVITKATDGTNVFKSVVLVMGAAATKVAIGMYAKYLPMVALLALAVLAVDDLITAFKGGDSVVAKFLDKILGKGEGKEFFKWFAEGTTDMGKRVDQFPGFGDKIEEVFSSIGFTIVKFFVDDLPDAWSFYWKDMNKKANTGGKTFSDFWKALFADVGKMIKDWVKDTAKNLVDGLTEGIQDAWETSKDKVKGFFQAVITTGEATLKVHSPSEESEYLGEMWVAGFVNKIRDGIAAIRSASEYAFGDDVLFPSALETLRGNRLLVHETAHIVPQNVSNVGDSHRTIKIENQITQTFEPSSAGVARAARDALSDNRRLIMSLEPGL